MFNLFQMIRALIITLFFMAVGLAETTDDLIVAHFNPVKTNYFLDEPIAVSLTVINQYANTVYIIDYMRAEFKLCSENGVTDKISNINRSCNLTVSAVVPLLPKGQLKKTYYINKSLKFEKPGKYCVDCTAEVEAQNVKGVKVHDRISFTLVKGSAEQLSKVYDELLEKTKTQDYRNTEAIEAALALSSVRIPLVVPYLVKAMAIPNAHAQESIIRALEEIKTPEAIKGIIGIETVPRNIFLKQYAIAALGRMKAKDGIPFLTRLLSDNDEETQISVIQALGQIGDAQSLDAIQQKMGHFKGKVKDTAIEVLKKSSPAK